MANSVRDRRVRFPGGAVETARDLGIRFANTTVECTRASDDEIDQNLPLEMRYRLLNKHEVRVLGGQ
jgi:hypothetical protein